jgi:hypothetical protein
MIPVLPIALLSGGILAFIVTSIAGLPAIASLGTIMAAIGVIWGGLSIFNKIKVCVKLIEALNTLVADLHKKLEK